MPLPGFPTRQPRPGDDTDARDYDPNTGGWTRPTTPTAPKKDSK